MNSPMPYTIEELETASRVLLGKIYGAGFGPDACREITREVLNSILMADGYTAPENKPERHNLIGFQIIDAMSNEDIIDEVLAHQRKEWMKASRNQLKKLIVAARMNDYQQRLMAEAKFGPDYSNGGLWGLFGGGNTTTDE